MKGLCRMICMGAVCLPLIFGGCGKKEASEYVELQGVVFSESFMPETGDWSKIYSRYSFSMDTEYGRKAFQVISLQEINSESIDALLEPGTKVKVQDIKKSDLDKQVYTVRADKIKVIDE